MSRKASRRQRCCSHLISFAKKEKERNSTSALHLRLALCCGGESRSVVEDGHCGVSPKGCSAAQNEQIPSEENER